MLVFGGVAIHQSRVQSDSEPAKTGLLHVQMVFFWSQVLQIRFYTSHANEYRIFPCWKCQKDTFKSDKLVWRKSRVTQTVTSFLYATSSPIVNDPDMIVSWVVYPPLNDMNFFSSTGIHILFSSFFVECGIHVISLGSFEVFPPLILSTQSSWVPCEHNKLQRKVGFKLQILTLPNGNLSRPLSKMSKSALRNLIQYRIYLNLAIYLSAYLPICLSAYLSCLTIHLSI